MANASLNGTAGENTNQTGDESLDPYIGPSVLITVFGTASNLLSLSYFITQRNFNNRKSRTEIINNRLFIVLNVFDILVCIFLLAILLFKILSDVQSKWLMMIVPFNVAVQTTGFITCLLSAIRTISVVRPRHHLNVKAIIVGIILNCGMVVYLNSDLSRKNSSISIARFLILSGLFIVVIFCNILCVAKLVYSKVASWKREASITMGILSAIYCVLNIGFLVTYGFKVFKCGFKESHCSLLTFEDISLFVLLPMNSASNPVVYFLRNTEMRKYLSNIWRKMTFRRPEQEERGDQDMTISNIVRDRTEVTEDANDTD